MVEVDPTLLMVLYGMEMGPCEIAVGRVIHGALVIPLWGWLMVEADPT